MKKEMWELDARFDSRKSFYGKAQVVESEDQEKIMWELFSYGTLVARHTYYKNRHDNTKCVYEYLGKWSQTTTRHQKEFFRQLGLQEYELDTLIKDGILEKRI